MLGKLLNTRSDSEKVNRFNKIIQFAKSVIETTNKDQKEKKSTPVTHPLIDVIRLLGRDLQTKYLTQLLFEEESSLPSLFPETMFFGGGNSQKGLLNLKLVTGKALIDFKSPVKIAKEVHLGRDLVLPWPWHRVRLINSISRIGKGRVWGSWEQDFSNHEIELWLPMGISWVTCGNHSIATGIIQCSGKIKPDYIYDISKIYDFVYCDGKDFICKQNNKVIAPVENVELAAIFEIGRIMKDNFISF